MPADIPLPSEVEPSCYSINMMWRNESFRGYADYADTEDFKSALNELKDVALHRRVACMCSEADGGVVTGQSSPIT